MSVDSCVCECSYVWTCELSSEFHPYVHDFLCVQDGETVCACVCILCKGACAFFNLVIHVTAGQRYHRGVLIERMFCFSLTTIFVCWQASYEAIKNDHMYAHPIPLTAYVLIALYETKDVSEVIGVQTLKHTCSAPLPPPPHLHTSTHKHMGVHTKQTHMNV